MLRPETPGAPLPIFFTLQLRPGGPGVGVGVHSCKQLSPVALGSKIQRGSLMAIGLCC